MEPLISPSWAETLTTMPEVLHVLDSQVSKGVIFFVSPTCNFSRERVAGLREADWDSIQVYVALINDDMRSTFNIFVTPKVLAFGRDLTRSQLIAQPQATDTMSILSFFGIESPSQLAFKADFDALKTAGRLGHLSFVDSEALIQDRVTTSDEIAVGIGIYTDCMMGLDTPDRTEHMTESLELLNTLCDTLSSSSNFVGGFLFFKVREPNASSQFAGVCTLSVYKLSGSTPLDTFLRF